MNRTCSLKDSRARLQLLRPSEIRATKPIAMFQTMIRVSLTNNNKMDPVYDRRRKGRVRTKSNVHLIDPLFFENPAPDR